MTPIGPGSTVGVMGGGQLGRMFAVAARRMGYRVHIFTPEQNGPAEQFADHAVIADYLNEGAVDRFARDLDVMTFEFENIPAETVRWCAGHCPVRPAGELLATTQHRLSEKTFLSGNGFPVAPFRAVRSEVELDNALDAIGRPAILKTAAWGYDGKGQQMIRGGEAGEIWEARTGDELILEKAIDFSKELSVIVARGPSGECAVFPLAENIHRNHILDFTVVPARVGPEVAAAAGELARDLAEKMDLIGLLAVEMFLDKKGGLLVNELAPRPHNSGHWSIEGCATSQFEQQLRAVCGLPLGPTTLLRPTAMANILGEVWRDGEPPWTEALAVPGVHLHLYGKHEPRPRRKMGHLTCLGESADEALAAVTKARDALCKPKS